MGDTSRIQIEVVFAWADQQIRLPLSVDEGATVLEAIEASRIIELIRQRDADYDFRPERVGVFGRRAELDQLLRDGDRIELYRPLLIDPKEARRARADADRAKTDPP